MKCLLSILLLLSLNSARGQGTHADTLRVGDTIDVQMLIGSWISSDSSRSRIEFQLNRKELKLVAGKDTRYDFFVRDTFFVNPLNGVLIKWPPDDCSVRVIDKSRIEISYTIFGGLPVRVYYEKLFDVDGDSRH